MMKPFKIALTSDLQSMQHLGMEMHGRMSGCSGPIGLYPGILVGGCAVLDGLVTYQCLLHLTTSHARYNIFVHKTTRPSH